MDRSATKTHGESKSDMLADERSHHTGNQDVEGRYDRIKNVFKLLIDEASYLIDDKAEEACDRTQSAKEQFAIKIDAIRKSLGIDSMDDVELLVETLYGYEAYFKDQQRKQRQKEREAELEAMEAEMAADPTRRIEQPALEEEESEEEDDGKFNLDPDNLEAALHKFHRDREERAFEDLQSNK